MSNRVYKFLSAQDATDNLEKRRIKVSTIDELNDPFDLCSIDTAHPAIEQALTEYITRFRRTTGLLCFSRNWDNLLMWSHYGRSHTGICLGFDIPDGQPDGGHDMEVCYQPNLLVIRSGADVNNDLANKLLRTKYEVWSYEQEVRLFVKLNDSPDDKGRFWFPFGVDLELREVIVGAQCSQKDNNALTQVLQCHHDSVVCSWAYMRRDAFSLIRKALPPPWFS